MPMISVQFWATSNEHVANMCSETVALVLL